MPAAPRIAPRDVFTADEWARLSSRSDLEGLGAVVHAWGVIALMIAVHAIWPNPLTWLLAVIVVGARQLGLAILMHEAAHGGLSVNQRVNDWVGQWLCAAPIGASLVRYRPYHLTHHRNTQQADDPDLGLAAHFPITPESFRRKALRDLTGQTFYKQRIAPLVRAAGRAVSPSAVLGGQDSARDYLLANAAVFIVFLLAGQGWAFWTIWMLAQATWLPFITRVRNIAEHAVATPDASDPWKLARTTRASWWEKALVAPYQVHFHAEHHLWMHIPFYRLLLAHRMLTQKGLTGQMEVRGSYLEVLRLATSRRDPVPASAP
jgi:fatty acid desaturase